MRKKSQDELGTLVTREMKVMLQDESLTKEQRFDILTAVMFDTPVKNTLLASFAKSLKAGFELVNKARYKAIERDRERRKNIERRRRKLGYTADDDTTCTDMTSHDTTCTDMTSHDGLEQNNTIQGISPYKPPKGGKSKVPKAVEPEDLLEGKRRRGGSTDKLAQRRRGAEDGVRIATLEEMTSLLAAGIESTEAFAHMRVNRRNLMRYLIPLVKKNCAAEDGDESRTSDEQRKAFGKLRQLILAGLAAWTEAWKADDWQFAPGKITKWLADEKWLEKPRKKAAPVVAPGCGRCGVEIG